MMNDRPKPSFGVTAVSEPILYLPKSPSVEMKLGSVALMRKVSSNL